MHIDELKSIKEVVRGGGRLSQHDLYKLHAMASMLYCDTINKYANQGPTGDRIMYANLILSFIEEMSSIDDCVDDMTLSSCYRGVSNANHDVNSTLSRECAKNGKTISTCGINSLEDYLNVLQLFPNMMIPNTSGNCTNDVDFKELINLRHYGLISPTIDFTNSIRVAIAFMMLKHVQNRASYIEVLIRHGLSSSGANEGYFLGVDPGACNQRQDFQKALHLVCYKNDCTFDDYDNDLNKTILKISHFNYFRYRIYMYNIDIDIKTEICSLVTNSKCTMTNYVSKLNKFLSLNVKCRNSITKVANFNGIITSKI